MEPAPTVEMFAGLAPDYDRLNKVVSLGLHQSWRRALADALEPLDGKRVLDLATGTGDIALLLAARGAKVTATDLAVPMLDIARAKAASLGLAVRWEEGDARAPEGEGYDAVTIAFGLRNLPDAMGALSRQARVLAPGGIWACLEAMEPDNAALRLFSRLYGRLLPGLVRLFGGPPGPYRYLADSMRTFPRPGA
ncbi:class I SAM-dependent methyltransferase, partial [bacterium]|nr:class I SAM-dependent methyltransferase [bacterium]